MPSYLDLGLLGVVAVSALLAMLRGFTREVMAIISWGVAAVSAVYFYPMLVPKLADPTSPVFIAKDALRPYAAGAAIFFLVLILVSIITIRLSSAILDSKIGPLDRALGFAFGAVRGLLLCAIAFIFFNWLAPESTAANPDSNSSLRNQWLANSRGLPLLKTTSDQLLALLPDDPDGILAKLKKHKPGAGEEAPPPETDQEPKAAPATPSPPVRPKAQLAPTALPAASAAGDDKRKMDSLIKGGR
ncbi:CvpA family protein [Rhodoblastus sp.]|uniref:CvpA family protein n=1 Tax=Rhodoblastus sp. TaxID=1962975 RepID=UPI003F9C0893